LNQKRKSNKKWKNILRFILLAICGAVFGVNIYLANAKTLVGNQLPMPFGYGAAVVLSGSMEPTFSTGDLIVVKEQNDYILDDIVVYQEASFLVVHRIVGIGESEVITKGDANNVVDEPIQASAIKGKVLFAIPGVGTVVNFLKSPMGTILVVATAIALIEIPRRKEKEKDDEERQKLIEEIKRLKDEI